VIARQRVRSPARERLRRLRRPVMAASSLALVAVFALGSGTAALAAGRSDANPPPPQSLAALRAAADAVRAELTAGAAALDAARSKLATLASTAVSAKGAAAQIDSRLAGLRDQLSGYAAQLYMDPSVQMSLTALTDAADLEVSVQGVQMLSIVNRGRTEVLRAVVVDEEQAEVLQTQAAQAAAAAAVVQKSVTAQVAALQAKAGKASTRLTAGEVAYQAALARAVVQRIATAKAAHNEAARALAVRQAAELEADEADVPVPAAQCGAASDGPYPAGPWGGYADGFIPSSQLCAIVGGGRLRPDAAAAFDAMSAAYARVFGSNLCVSDSYRSYSQQLRVFRQRPSLAAVPGTSNHGWGLAVDLGCGVQYSRSAQYRWMVANAARFGWVHPSWAVHDPFEPWHWEFGHLSGAGGT
jgi:D-alanyl-D-alanine carboxypeptidase